MNLEYLLHHFQRPYFEILFRRFNKPTARLHADGWYELNTHLEGISKEKMIKKNTDKCRLTSQAMEFSISRYDTLLELIRYLRGMGEVYLVRLPVDGRILQVEDSLIPGFNDLMGEVVIREGVKYLDMAKNPDKYTFTDSIHLHKESARKVSMEVGNWVLDVE